MDASLLTGLHQGGRQIILRTLKIILNSQQVLLHMPELNFSVIIYYYYYFVITIHKMYINV
jgi:hypothetical protein